MSASPPETAAELRDALPASADLAAVARAIADSRRAILVADRTGRYVAVNRAACRLTGFTRAELLRMGVTELTAIEDEKVADPLWRGFLESGEQRGEFVIARKDGSSVRVRYEAVAHLRPGLHISFITPL